MENKSILNTVLLIIVIILLLIAIFYIVTKDSKKEVINLEEGEKVSLEERQADAALSIPLNTEPKPENNIAASWSVISVNGMGVSIPEGFTYDTQVARVAGDSAVALNIGYNNKMVISIYKWNNNALYLEEVPKNGDFASIDSNYTVGGVLGVLYKAKEQDAGLAPLGDIVAIPSKNIIMQIEKASWIGIPEETLTQIVASVKL